MKIAVIGTGYVGLVTGTCFAESGNEVFCIDKDTQKIALLEQGQLPIYEPGLLELVQRNRREGRLHFGTDLAAGIAPAQLIFIAVGTPQSADGSADLTTLWAVADALAEHIQGPKTVVIKSTVPVGTNRGLAERLAARNKQPIDVVSNPEFLKEGAAIEDCMKPDRVVVGVRRPEVAEVLHELYAPFLRTERPFLAMSPESAEMTKYVANAMLATKISFINEMANLCEKMGADINDVRRGIGHDARIGFQFLFPGAGYGGSCFLGEENIFVEDGKTLTATSLASLFQQVAARAHPAEAAASVGSAREENRTEQLLPLLYRCNQGISQAEVIDSPPELQVLSFDLESGAPCLAQVRALTRREYDGKMVEMKTSMGRRLCVTADHPVILYTSAGLQIVPAEVVCPGDQMLALNSLPPLQPPTSLNLVEQLEGTKLDGDVLVSVANGEFAEQYPCFAAHIPRALLRQPLEIKWGNRMRLSLYRYLSARGVLDVGVEKLQLYTAKGAAARCNALIPINADFARLCGYFLAEGFISFDIGRKGARRERIGFCFHVNEREYISDVQRILASWGLKFCERCEGSSSTTTVSSRVLAWLLRDLLQCGTCSEDKALPRLAFNLPVELRLELLRGAISGDGSVTEVQKGRNFMLEYATVSKRLADSLALLLQSVGIIPSLRPRWMKKSTQPAYLLRISGHNQLAALREMFGGKQRSRIDSLLSGYQRIIRQCGFSRNGSYSLLKVRAVEHEPARTTVYSLETSTGTVVAASGLICHNCFPKDVRALISMSRQLETPTPIMAAVDEVNEAQKQVLVHKVRRHYGEGLRGKTLAIWGLAFKPRTDDVREAPSLVLIDALLADGVKLRVHDSEAMNNVRALYGDRLVYCDRPYGALEGAHGLVIVTEWQEFRNPDFEVMRRLLQERVLFDGRNLYDPRVPASYGFTYYSIGRKIARPGRHEEPR